MRILLLEHPRKIAPDRCNDIANTPLTSCLLTGYAAGMLAGRGHEVEIVEGYLDDLSYTEIEKRISTFDPDVLGVHMVYHWKGDSELFSFLRKVKNEGMARYVAAYGFYPTFAFREILNACEAIDSVVVGEVEATFAELAEKISMGESVQGMPGLAARNSDGSVSWTRRELIEDLDSIPFPVRTDAMFRIPEVNIQGSRGCYGACTFCYVNPFYGERSRWRGRSPENIVAEIDQVIEERGLRRFYFVDPNFFGPGERGQRRARQLAALLRERNITFGIEGRVNDIHDETISALVDAGLSHILIGLESGRDASLKRMNKMTTVADNERALKILRKNGIEPNIGFIMFEPDSTLEDVRVNYEFLQRNDLLKNLPVTANLLYHHQIILKGTPAYRMLQEQGRLKLVNESSYEGVTDYRDKAVEDLAWVMRMITNFLFFRMAGIWSGRVTEPPGATEMYRRINDLLVQRFESLLSDLESGKRLSGNEKESYVKEVEKEIENILESFMPARLTK